MIDLLRTEKDLLLELFRSKPWFRGIGISTSKKFGTLTLSLRVKIGKAKEAQKELDKLQLESRVEILEVGEMKARPAR